MGLELILGMAVVTFATRYIPFALSHRLQLPAGQQTLFNYISIAILTAILAKTSLVRDEALQITVDNPMLWAALVTGTAAAAGVSRSLCFVAGLSVFLLLLEPH